jgi:hypothetical protein
VGETSKDLINQNLKTQGVLMMVVILETVEARTEIKTKIVIETDVNNSC